MPTKNLEADKTIMDTVTVGTVTHKLKVANNDGLELYEYPGGYASRFDGINKSGGDQADKLQKVFEDNKRTVGIRMQAEALSSLLIRGRGVHAGFTAGHTFDLTKHYSDDGTVVITSGQHDAEKPASAAAAAEGIKKTHGFTS